MSADPAPSTPSGAAATLRFTDLGLPEPLLRAPGRRRLRIPLADPGRDHPAAAAGPRRARPGADRHRQDRRVRAADPRAASIRRSTSRRRWCWRRRANSRSRSPRRSRSTPRTCPASTCCRSTAARATGRSCSALKRGVHVVVGTPGRVIDHLERGSLDLSRAALPGARRSRRDAAHGLHRRRRGGAEEDARRRARSRCSRRRCRRRSGASRRPTCSDPVEVAIKSKTTTATNIRQRYWMVSGMHKLDALTRILEAEPFDAHARVRAHQARHRRNWPKNCRRAACPPPRSMATSSRSSASA